MDGKKAGGILGNKKVEKKKAWSLPPVCPDERLHSPTTTGRCCVCTYQNDLINLIRIMISRKIR